MTASKNLQDIAVEANLEKHIQYVKWLANSRYEDHVTAWKAYYERDFQTKFFSVNDWRRLDVWWVAAMDTFVQAGTAPTPAQVGARSHLVCWLHKLYRQTGPAYYETFKAWSVDLGRRIVSAQGR